MTPNRRYVLAGLALVAILAAHGFDEWAYRTLPWPAAGDRDWGRLLRVLGFAPTWLVIALAFWLEGRGRSNPADRRAVVSAKSVVVAVLIGGVVSELVKLVIRRERPNLNDGIYQFRTFGDDPFNSSPLGMPSGHTMVAFSGAGALSRRFPRAAPIILALAAGCGLTRLFAQAHFLSDVVAGAIGGGWLGWVVAGRIAASETAT